MRIPARGSIFTFVVTHYVGPNRRARRGDAWYNKCRLCWAPLTFDVSQVEVTSVLTYYRCPNCGGSFPMRREDVVTFGQHSNS